MGIVDEAVERIRGDDSVSEEEAEGPVDEAVEDARQGSPPGATDTDGDGEADASVPPEQEASDPSSPAEDDAIDLDGGSSGGGGGATDTDGDGDPDASVPPEQEASDPSGSDEGSDPGKVNEAVQRLRDSLFSRGSRVEEAREYIENRDIRGSDDVEQAVNRKLLFQSENTQEAFENFTQAVEVEESAVDRQQQVKERIDSVQGSESDVFVTESGNRISKGEAVSRLQERSESLEDLESRAASAQEDIANPRPEVISFQSLPDQVADDLRDQLEGENETDSRGRSVEYAGYTDVRNVRSQADPLSDPDVLENYKQNLEGGKDVAAVLATPAGVQAAFSVFDPEKTGAGIINRKSEEIGSMGSVEAGTQLLSSPAGLVLGGAAGKAAAGGFQGVRAGLGGTGSRLLSGVEYGAAGAGSLFVGSEIGRGAAQASQGDVSEGLARVALTGAEAGAVAKGFASGVKKYSPSVSGSTTVRQTNFLDEVADEDALRGFGKLEARTPVTRNKLLGGSETDEIVSRAGYTVEAGDQGSTASGRLVQEQVSGGSVEKDFESFTNVRGQDVDTVFVDEDGSLEKYDVAGDEAVSSSTVRFEDDSGFFRDYEDFSTISASRRQGEKPVSSIDVYSEEELGEDASLAGLQGVTDDVAVRVRFDVDARRVRFSSRSLDDRVVTRADNVVFSRNTDEFGGGSSGGAGLKSGRSGGFVSETQRQVEAAEAVGERSRRMVQADLDSDSVPFTAAGDDGGGAAASGSEAGLGMVQSRSFDGVQLQQDLQGEGSGSYEPVENVQRQRSVAGQESDTFQRDGNASQGSELNSTASDIVRRRKNEMISGSSPGILDQDQSQELIQDQTVEQKQVVDQKQILDQKQVLSRDQKLKPVKAKGKVRGRGVQGLKAAGVSQVSGIRTVQLPQFKQLQDLSAKGVGKTLGFTVVRIPGTGAPGAGGFMLQSPDATRGSVSTSKNRKSGLSSGRYVNPDWFSANAVEQVTDEQAVYDFSEDAENPLFGLKTVQESEGKVSEREIYDTGKKSDLL